MKQILLRNIYGVFNLQFRELMKFFIFIFATQIVLTLFRIPLYSSFMVCMLLYLYKKNINDKFVFKEEFGVVYLNFSIFVILLIINLISQHSWVLFADIVYFSYYTFMINREMKKQKTPSLYTNSKNVVSIFNYFTVFAIVIICMRLYERNFDVVLGFKVSVLYIGVLFLCIVFALIFLKTFQKEIVEEEKEQVNSSERLLLEAYKMQSEKIYLEGDNPLPKKIIQFYETSSLYLNSEFNLFDLANELGCGRAELSEALNRDMNTGFYSLTGLFRIEHAKRILLKKENYTIEAMIAQCGFQSKSTFNKYFKEFVGVKPSVYRKLHSTSKKI